MRKSPTLLWSALQVGQIPRTNRHLEMLPRVVPESRVILPLLFMQDGPSLGFLDYFFNPACQFVTTVSGGDAAPDALTVFTRNRFRPR